MGIISQNITRVTRDGFRMYASGSTTFLTSTSQSSSPQILVVTCSADVGNNLATTASLSGFFTIPVFTGSAASTRGEINVNIFYVTASIFDLVPGTTGSITGTATYFEPESTTNPLVTNINVPVRILKNETAANVAIKTNNSITNSLNARSFISSSVSASTLRIESTVSGANNNNIVISASGFTYNYIQSGSFGDGSTYMYRPEAGSIVETSASFAILRDTDPDDVKFERKLGSSTKPLLFFSGSGKIGIGTLKPETDVDIRAESFQVQRLSERRGIKVNPEGNIESFDKNVATATTGSEYILKYSRGVTINLAMMQAIAVGKLGLIDLSEVIRLGAENAFNSLSSDLQLLTLEKAEENGFINPPQVGDTLGQIRWVAESGSIDDFDQRGTGETAAIKAKVADVDNTGITSTLEFHVSPGKTVPASSVLTLDGELNHTVTGSLTFKDELIKIDGTNGDIDINAIKAHDNSNTKVDFNTNQLNFHANHSTATVQISNNALTVNPSKTNFMDFNVKGDNDDNLVFGDAANDKIGIGTSSPSEKLTVTGNISASGNIIGKVDGGSF